MSWFRRKIARWASLRVSRADSVEFVRKFTPSLLVVIALGAQFSLPQLIAVQRYILLYPAIIFGALIGGGGAGFFASVLAMLGAWYWFVPYERSFIFGGTARDLIGFTVFGGSSILITILGSRIRSARLSAQAVNRKLIAANFDLARYAEIVSSSNDPIIGKTIDGTITSWNEAAERAFGYSASEMVGQSMTTLIPPNRKAEEDAILARLIRGERIEHYDTERVRKDGTSIEVSITISPIKDAAGKVIGASKIVRDVTERRTAERLLQRKSEELEVLNQNLEGIVAERTRELELEVESRAQMAEQLRLAQGIAHIGTFDLNLETGFNTWTPELEKMYGLEPGGFSSTQTAWEKLVHPEDRDRAIRAFDLATKTNQPVEEEWRVVWPDGSIHWLTGRFQALKDGSGKPTRLTGVNIDITKRKQAEIELRDLTRNLERRVQERTAEVEERDQRLRFALNAARAGAWDWNIESNEVEWDSAMFHIFGVTPEFFRPTYSGFIALLHPEDRESTNQAVAKCIEGVQDLEAEYQVIWPDGSLHYVLSRGKSFRDNRGKPIHMLGICWDITQRKQEEIARQAERKKAEDELRTLAAVAESSNDFIGICDPDMRPIYLNESGMRMVGLESMEEVKKTRVLDYFWPEDRKQIEEEAIPALTSSGRWSGVCRFRNFKTGEPIHTIWNAFLIRDSHGQVTGWATVSPNLNQLKTSEDKIRAALLEKEVLLREIHHRVKNNLNVISSLLELQAMGINDKEVHDAFIESQNRVMSMALIHEKLYQSKDIARLDFANYVKDLVQCIYHSYGKDPKVIRPQINVEELELDIDTAIPCSLIINELVSNSLKHAFPKDRPGQVSVSLHSLGEKPDTFELEVIDDGVGFPEGFVIDQARSLGLKLVQSLARQLGGSLVRDGSPQGADCKIQFSVRKRKARAYA